MPASDPRATARAVPAAWSLGGLAAASVFTLLLVAGFGGAHGSITGAGIVLWRLGTAGGLAAMALLAAYGYGRLLDPLARGHRDPVALRWALGVAVWFTLVHLLGWLGALSPLVASLITGVGLALALVPWARRVAAGGALRVLAPRPSLAWCALPAVAVLLVASANPPGWLWGSEFGGYDALSYHLPLVREWIDLGSIRPVEHSVYSYLPSYIEAGFVQLAQLGRLPGTLGLGEQVARERALLAHAGLGAHAAHFLHAGLGLVAARVVAGVVRAALPDHRGAGGIAAGITLATPWVVVVGSLAYNELGVVLLGAGALAAAMPHAWSADAESDTAPDALAPWQRGLLAGLLTGAACGFKPTALLFVAPAAGVAMLWGVPSSGRARAWLTAIGAACLAGLVMIAPWLIRNALAGGNPVFPQLTGLLGSAHWDAEQAARYAGAHRVDLGVTERLRLLVWSDPGTDPQDPMVERFRGFANPQWAALPVLALAGATLAWVRGVARPAVALLGIGLVLQVIAWLVLTHLQSRFLLPSVAWLAALVALGCASLGRWGGAVGGATVLALGAVAMGLFSQQGRLRGDDATLGVPNLWLLPGTAAFAGPEAWTEDGFDARYDPTDVGDIPPNELAWTAAVNGLLPSGSRLLLVGDATPFYVAGPVVYATTYDRSVLAEAMLGAPGDPAAWTPVLRAHGITHVLVAPGELGRLDNSGWLDPVYTAALDADDPASPNTLSAWLATLGRPLVVWPTQGNRALFSLGDQVGDASRDGVREDAP